MSESSKEQIWHQIAQEIGGQYVTGDFWHRDSLRFSAGPWEITLDHFTVTTKGNSSVYTRMRAPFINQDGLYFKIHRKTWLAEMGKFFGMQDIQTGDAFFDENFIIKSNQADKVRQLLNSQDLKALIQAQPDISFQIHDDGGIFATSFPQGVDALYFQCHGLLTEASQIKSLFDLFMLTLERLVQIDAACAEDPQIRL